MKPIYTLDYIFKEAGDIASFWNGSDEKFIDGNGEPRTSEDAEMANEIMETIKELRGSINHLGI